MMRVLEGISLWTGIVLYLVGFLFFLAGLVFKKEKPLSWAWVVAALGFLSQNLAIAARWLESGHFPFYGTYEHFLAQSWFFMAIYFIAGAKRPTMRRLGVGVLPFCVLLLGYGMMSEGREPQPLPPPYQSLWLWVHTVSWFAYGAFFTSAITSALYLLKEKGAFELLPSKEDLDAISFRMMVFGFVTLTIGMGAGAIWAHGLWGRYWAWDPIETWTLITWLVYGLNIHLRVSFGLKGRRAAYLAIASAISPIITLGGIGFVGGVHTTLL